MTFVQVTLFSIYNKGEKDTISDKEIKKANQSIVKHFFSFL